MTHELDYQNFPVRDEAGIRAVVQVFCLGAGLATRVEVHSPLGRSDIEIVAEGRLTVLELKYDPVGRNADRLLAEAREQLLSRDYGSASAGLSLTRLALVFSGKERKFSAIAEA